MRSGKTESGFDWTISWVEGEWEVTVIKNGSRYVQKTPCTDAECLGIGAADLQTCNEIIQSLIEGN